ncbi:MAG: GNAT family N-acetyltransferase [Clostridiales bacterium]|nr:GNAT family N-acetyltransferase [Clostridiales bacterium]
MLKHKGSQVIKTERLILRPFRLDDAYKMHHNWAKDPEVTRYLTWQAHKNINETARILGAWLAAYTADNYYHWAIEHKGEPIGGISLADISDRDGNAKIGYCLGRAYWNKGFMSEALEAVLDFLFSRVSFKKLSAFHDIENPASGRVLEKAGMKQEGILRQEKLRSSGEFADLRLLAILQDEWLDKKKQKR